MRRGSAIDELLTIIFMILAIGAVLCFFILKGNPTYMILGGCAVLLRVVQYILRFF